MRTFWRRVSLKGKTFMQASASAGGTNVLPAIFSHGSDAAGAARTAGAKRAARAARRAKVCVMAAGSWCGALEDGATATTVDLKSGGQTWRRREDRVAFYPSARRGVCERARAGSEEVHQEAIAP